MVYTLLMNSDPSRVTALLKSIHLFSMLNEERLFELTRVLTEFNLAENEILYQEGDHSDSFFLIFDGRIQMTQGEGEDIKVIATWIAGDYFGEESFFSHKNRTTTITAVTDCILFRVDYKRFSTLLARAPDLKENLIAVIASRRLVRLKTWKWLAPDEVVYMVVRKHPYFLILYLLPPAFVLISSLTVFLFLVFDFSQNLTTTFGFYASGIVAAAAMLWGLWNFYDWANDYCFITNQRIIWLEVTLGIFQSRKEAPLKTLLSVQTTRSLLGRILGFGDVIVRTYTGIVPLARVNYPDQIAKMVEEYWKRVRFSPQKEAAIQMERSIRQKLKPASPAEEMEHKDSEGEKLEDTSRIPWWRKIADQFRLRYEEGQVITYRKHWLLLFRSSWKQLLFLLGFGYFFFSRISYMNSIQHMDLLSLALLAGTIVSFFFWLYRFVDWHNDIYQVSLDQIIDIERKPLQTENRKTAPLENILSIEYERQNIIQMIFRFGSVLIKVGETTFNFDHVFNPGDVQQEIFHRKVILEKRLEQEKIDAERDRLSTWIATYHQTSGGQPLANPSRPSGVEIEELEERDNREIPENEKKDGFGWIE
jgi:uncharacterized membrane protein YdbT with pleckstrin-like domain